MHAYIHSFIHDIAHAYIHTEIHDIYAWHIWIHTYTNTYIHTYQMYGCLGANSVYQAPAGQNLRRSALHTYIYTYMHTYIPDARLPRSKLCIPGISWSKSKAISSSLVSWTHEETKFIDVAYLSSWSCSEYSYVCVRMRLCVYMHRRM